MKYIEKKFIRELSKILDCSVCFSCLNDPLECSQCETSWCRTCIEKNERKCPNKCQNSHFKKPHRLIRQFISEVYIYCDTCNQKVKCLDNQKHQKVCLLEIENKKRKLSEQQQLLHQNKLKKIIKREQQLINEANENHIKIEHTYNIQQDMSNSQSPILYDNNSKNSENICDRLQSNDIFSNFDSIKNQLNTEIIQLKQEQFYKNNSTIFSDSSYHNLQSFKQMNILIYKQEGWQPLEQQLNQELNFKMIKFLEKNENSNEMIIKIRNIIFDFTKLETYEVYSTLRVDDNQEFSDSEDKDSKPCYIQKDEKKNKEKFIPFNNEEDLLKYMKVYFLCESDRVYYEDFDKKNIFQEYLNDPYNTQIYTFRSTINFQTMTEYNGTKTREIRFEIFQ